MGRSYGSQYEWKTKNFALWCYYSFLGFSTTRTTEEVDADEFKFQDVVENDPYWQWEDEYTVVPKNPPKTWVSGTTYKKRIVLNENGTIYRCVVATSPCN